jgi:hypothetical protein
VHFNQVNSKICKWGIKYQKIKENLKNKNNWGGLATPIGKIGWLNNPL